MGFFADPLNTFVLGIAVGWLVTHVSLTYPQRTVKNVRNAAARLVWFHDLTPGQERALRYKDWVTDEEGRNLFEETKKYLFGDPNAPGYVRREIWRWAKSCFIGVPFKQAPEYLAAEILLCTKVLGLTHRHAWATMRRIRTLDDIKESLVAVSTEIAEEDRRRQEKVAAEKAVEAERQAKANAMWEAMRNGDDTLFEEWIDDLVVKPPKQAE